jgi:hypothetical protein
MLRGSALLLMIARAIVVSAATFSQEGVRLISKPPNAGQGNGVEASPRWGIVAAAFRDEAGALQAMETLAGQAFVHPAPMVVIPYLAQLSCGRKSL